MLLMHPDVARGCALDVEDLFPSIGLGYLAASLRDSGFEVKCLDGFSMAALAEDSEPSSFLCMAEKIIQEYKPDVVGIASTSHTRKDCIEIAQLVKKIDQCITVVLGGPFVSLLGGQILVQHHNIVDFVVSREGEVSFSSLLLSIANGNHHPDIPGVGYFVNGQTHETGKSPRILKLDQLPCPDYSGNVGLYNYDKIPTIGMVTSRGCPYNCHFCGSHAFWGQPCISMSSEQIVSEMDYLQRKYGTELFKFHDDTFTLSRQRTFRLFEEIRQRGLTVRLYMHTTINGADSELLKVYRSVGGESIFFGLESGSARIRDLMGKPSADIPEFVRTAKAAKDLGISVGVFVLLGYPRETISDIRATFDLLEQIVPDDVYVSTVKIQPGTLLCTEAKEQGLHKDMLWFREDDQYFTYVKSRERLELIDGCILLLDELYRKRMNRSIFENNNEANELRSCSAKCDALKSQAKRILNL